MAQQIIPQSRIHDIILAEGFQGFLPLNVKPLDFIGDIGILQRFEISLNGMGYGFDFSIAFRQQSLADQGISNRGCGDTVADIIRKEHHQIAKQERIRNGVSVEIQKLPER